MDAASLVAVLEMGGENGMNEVEEAIASAIEAQADDDAVGWVERQRDGKLGIEYAGFDIGKFIVALEAAGYSIEKGKFDAGRFIAGLEAEGYRIVPVKPAASAP